jgi:hypothetical protein
MADSSYSQTTRIINTPDARPQARITQASHIYQNSSTPAPQVCFGMVRRIRKASLPCPTNGLKITISIASSALPDFCVDRVPVSALGSHSRKIVSSENASVINSLHGLDGHIIQELFQDAQIELQLQYQAASKSLGQKRETKLKTPKGALKVIIYGPIELFEGVGSFLYENKCFIQDPIGCDRRVEYRNPHRLSSSDPEPIMTTVDEHSFCSLECSTKPVDILKNFESGGSLPEAESSPAISTELYRQV